MVYDIVWLLETKMCFNLTVPGFNVYLNASSGGKHRIGVVALVKGWLTEHVSLKDILDTVVVVAVCETRRCIHSESWLFVP